MRKTLIVANWKMHHGIAETLKFLAGLKKELLFGPKAEIVLCPPFTSLYTLSVALADQKFINMGAQNCHWESKGAFTGEISPTMLEELECDYVLLGHSERRHVFGETNEMIQKKVSAALSANIKPIFCCGEKLDQRQNNQTFDIIQEQLKIGLSDVSPDQMPHVTIAYEPVWAIGTGQNATPEQAEEVHVFLRKALTELFNAEIAQKTLILYGGSVKPDNTEALLKQTNIDGLLIGGASLSLDSFVKIIQYARS